MGTSGIVQRLYPEDGILDPRIILMRLQPCDGERAPLHHRTPYTGFRDDYGDLHETGRRTMLQTVLCGCP